MIIYSSKFPFFISRGLKILNFQMVFAPKIGVAKSFQQLQI